MKTGSRAGLLETILLGISSLEDVSFKPLPNHEDYGFGAQDQATVIADIAAAAFRSLRSEECCTILPTALHVSWTTTCSSFFTWLTCGSSTAQ